MMLTDFLRYPGVFKKSVRGEMCLFCRYLKLFLLWVQKTPELGHF